MGIFDVQLNNKMNMGGGSLSFIWFFEFYSKIMRTFTASNSTDFNTVFGFVDYIHKFARFSLLLIRSDQKGSYLMFRIKFFERFRKGAIIELFYLWDEQIKAKMVYPARFKPR